MKNPLQPKILSWLIPAVSVLGFLLRAWLFATGFDESGLLRPGHPANALIFLLTAAVLLVIFLCVRGLKGPRGYKALFKRSRSAAAGCFIAALGILAAAIGESATTQSNMTVLSWVLGIPAMGSLVFVGLCRLRHVRPNFIFHGCVTVYLMIHVICQYRNWSSEPQLQVYGFQMLASVFLMLASYHCAALDAGISNRRKYAFFSYSAVFLCCLALTGGDRLFYLAMAVWMYTNSCSLAPAKPERKMYLPRDVLYCIEALEDAGYSAYAVGGCVRDSLLERKPQDYDLCTSATPEQTAKVFGRHRLILSGQKHGTVGVVLNGEVYEITTFRTEGGYSDNRHPGWVEFVTTVEDDLARRDFTINAMAYAPGAGYIDPWGGQADLKNGVLRTVGDPAQRFREDALRILRGVRFAVRFGLRVEADTQAAMLSLTHLMDSLARERVFSELCKILLHVNAADLLRFQPIITQVIPELAPAVNFDQKNAHHTYDVYTHTAYTVQAAPESLPLRLAALLHDIGKPQVFTVGEDGQGHFYGHAEAGARIANEVLLRLKAPTALRNQVVFLVEHHMSPITPDKKLLRRRVGKYGIEAVEQLLALQRADFGGKGVIEENDSFMQVEALLTELRLEDACLTVKDLAINGQDLLSLGVEPGKHIGACMKFLLELVQDEVLSNTKEELLSAAKHFFDL